jgi:hypothetical protein
VEDVASLTRDVPLKEGVRISGFVRGIDQDPAGMRIRFVPVRGRPPAIRPVEVPANEHGRFAAADLAPGRYVIRLVSAEPSWSLVSVRLGGLAQPEPMIEVGTSASDSELELVAVPNTASLVGALHVAGASSYVLVLLTETAPAHPFHDRQAWLTRADNNGSYVFSNRPPGRYVLIVLKEMEPTNIDDIEFLDTLRKDPSGVPIALSAATETKLDLRAPGR